MKKLDGFLETYRLFYFRGSHIMYPLLSLFLLFFYYDYFGNGYVIEQFSGEISYWPYWNLIGVFAFFLLSVWLNQKGAVSRRFVGINSIIIFISLLIYATNFLGPQAFLIFMQIFWGVICIFKIIQRPFNLKSSWIWSLPLLYIGLYYIFKTNAWIVIWTMVLTGLTAYLESKWNHVFRIIIAICTIIFSLLLALGSFSYNPFLSFKNVKQACRLYINKNTSLILEKDNKFELIDGWAWNEKKLINISFDTIRDISPYYNKFLGISILDPNDSKMYDDINFLFLPIVVEKNMAYYSCDKNIYDVLQSSLASEVDSMNLKRHTAQIFYDYLDLISKNDSTSINKITTDYSILQKLINKNIENIKKRVPDIKKETRLRDFSKNLASGMLNALSSDLILNGDYDAALKMFSLQFFINFLDSKIYDRVSTTINAEIDLKYGSLQEVYGSQLTDKGLRSPNSYIEWSQMFTTTSYLAEKFILEQYSKSSGTAVQKLREISENMSEMGITAYLGSEKIKDQKEQLEEVSKLLSSYATTPHLLNYVTMIQQVLYDCITNNDYKEYNSYFLNRFNDVSIMVPMNPLSLSAYDDFNKYYNLMFENEIKEIKKMRSLFDELNKVMDHNNSLGQMIQEKIKELIK